MKVWIFTLLGSVALFAADEQRLALVAKAQTDFDRVEMAGTPPLRDAQICVQTEAAMASIALPEELPRVLYRKGYCTLVASLLTHDTAGLKDAAATFDRAVLAWPDRPRAKNQAIEPVPAGLRVMAAVAKLESGPDEAVVKELTAAVAAPCADGIMPAKACEAAVQLRRQWLGWTALRAGDLDAAAREFAGTPASPWAIWISGRQAFRNAQYADAAARYRRAIERWKAEAWSRFAPAADWSRAYTDFGGAQLLAGDTAGAIASLTQAAKEDAANSQALALRARAHEVAGQTEAAMADYNIASRTAFAHAVDLASGEAHLYRGIVLYRRKDFAHAEDEFASALNFDIAVRGDAVAWRHLAAVASGDCEASRPALEKALSGVSPYFPKDEARMRMSGCNTAAHALR